VLVVAFILTALAGVLLGIWLAARAAGQMPTGNPVRMWAFIETMKSRTIEAYSKELTAAIRLKYPDDGLSEYMATFIDEYTVEVLKHQTNRR
jgi:hypothetical protein